MVEVGDRLQYETGEGPCLDAIWTEETVYNPSLGYDRRWPRWGPRVVGETGAHSVLAFRLFTDRHTVGALNLCSRVHDAFDDTDRREGHALAAHIAIAVASVQQIDSLTDVLDPRSVIGQATGILMERYQLDQPRAFAVLARVSSTEERKASRSRHRAHRDPCLTDGFCPTRDHPTDSVLEVQSRPVLMSPSRIDRVSSARVWRVGPGEPRSLRAGFPIPVGVPRGLPWNAG
jgi:hypothetical protein